MNRTRFGIACVILLAVVFGCQQGDSGFPADDSEGFTDTLSIISGSENESLEPLLEKFSRETGIKIEMHYKGSVDIMLLLREPGTFAYDAVWPANGLWLAIGDAHHRVKNERSIMTSPVVFGIRKSKAEALGFMGPENITVQDILDKVRTGELKFMMTSATQSNSGASAYMGFLYALAGSPEMLTAEHLSNPEISRKIRDLLSGINRSSGSSGWLKELFLEGDYEAMVNYEAMVIEANQELVRRGREPLWVVYPRDGIVFADSPLGYIERDKPGKRENFQKLQEYLLSSVVQTELVQYGRRTALGNLTGVYPKDIFNPDWGIDTDKVLSPINMPRGDVILSALDLYQKTFRKPSFTVFCLDFSGSMKGAGERQLKQAMSMLLTPDMARKYMLQQSERDRMVVIPFSDRVEEVLSMQGSDHDELNHILAKIEQREPAYRTDLFTPSVKALEILASSDSLEQYVPAVILLTDGEHSENTTFSMLRDKYHSLGLDIPIFAILFGQASERELKQITAMTHGRIFDGRQDLIKAFRKAKGYN